ncbi:hypothetical protein [Hymenobacter sp. BT491]|uniref:hypothetical protein n=1 Tax=Hymenobacter sp. BT491 TaxID=2766779 RepID=UPI00165344F3|nr:hypothetical protein [Hymenobacter sp. BT491]MBC6990397.1 hypothetical protein [Hymenobacter sp. BT491]
MNSGQNILGVFQRLAVLVLLFAALFGCNNNSAKTEDTATESPATVTQDTAVTDGSGSLDTMAVGATPPATGSDSEDTAAVPPPPPPPPPTSADGPPPPQTPRDLVDNYLKKGNLGYYVPDSMKVNVPSRVSLVISKNKPAAALKRSLESSIAHEARPDTSRITLDRIKVSKQMVAKLYAMDSTAFRIEPLSHAQQYVDLQDTTETKWEWSVVPLKAGNQNLIIKASARVYDGDVAEWIDLEVYNGVVPVKAVIVPKPERVLSYWKENQGWIITTGGALGGLITWLLATFKRKKATSASAE